MSETGRKAVYCWFDTEYTDLDLDRARILEVALIVTDETLEPIGVRPAGIPSELLTQDGFLACLLPPPRAEISRHVLDHYQPLLEKCERQGRRPEEIDGYLASYLDQFDESRASDPKGRPILAGNSIASDYFLARRFFPRFVERLNYRRLDVSSFKIEWQNHFGGARFRKKGNAELIARYYPGRDPVTGDKHDAYFDVQASIAELAFYRAHLRRVDD